MWFFTGRTPRRKTVFCDRPSKNARAILSELDVDFAESPARADLIWMRRGYTRMLHSLRRYQLLNHIPDESAMVNKERLTGYLGEFDRMQPVHGLSLGDFYPETYRLHDDDERRAFFAQLPQQGMEDDPWILKPAGLSRGKGIRILWQPEEFRRLRRDLDENGPAPYSSERYIAQRYIRNPTA